MDGRSYTEHRDKPLNANIAKVEYGMVYYNDIDGYCCDVLRHNITAGNLYEGTVDERSITEIDPIELRGYGQIHLFAGIGGFPLGFRWAGMPAAFSVLTGGFPCQPFSVAGKRRGKNDDRALWPEMRRVIRGVRPRWVVCENVSGIIGMELRTVLSDLEVEDYTIKSVLVLPACGLNASHRRERVWIMAHADAEREPQPERVIGKLGRRIEYGGEDVADAERGENNRERGNHKQRWDGVGWYSEAAQQGDGASDTNSADRCGENVGDSECIGLEGDSRRGAGAEPANGHARGSEETAWFPKPGLGGNANGIPAELDAVAPLGAEQYPWEPPRVTKERENRSARIKVLGNAIVPQLAMVIGRNIMEYENFNR